MVNQECAQVRNPHETVVFARAIVIGGLAKRMKKVSKGLNIAAYLDTIATTRSWHNMLQNSRRLQAFQPFRPLKPKRYAATSQSPEPDSWSQEPSLMPQGTKKGERADGVDHPVTQWSSTLKRCPANYKSAK